VILFVSDYQSCNLYMAEITPEILRQIMPTLPKSKREEYAPMLDVSMAEFGINNERRVAAYLSNLAHESANLTRWEENLNYSARRLTQVWPRRFPTIEIAMPFAHNPEALANKTYGGRMGNNKPGDGWKYRGRAPLQITGKSLYQKAGEALGIDLVNNPDLVVEDKMIGFRVSAWVFAVEKGGNHLADKLQIKALTKAINGGYNGLNERIDLFNRGLRILPDDFKLQASARPLRDDESILDYIEGAEDEEIIAENISEGKGLSTSPDAKEGETEGVPPPIPAIPVEPSKPSLMSKLAALSMPAGAVTFVTGLWTFVSGIPPWGWAIIGGCFIIMIVIGAWLYNESMKRAASRTSQVINAAADKDKNNVRII
jgi:putative chitinase